MSNPPKRNLDQLDQYEQWRTQVESSINLFTAVIPSDKRSGLDNSPQSLDIVESWLLHRYPNPEATTEESDLPLLRGAIFYVGETYRSNLGGYWNVHFAQLEPDYEYGENPVIEGFYKDLTICPYFDVLDAIQKRYGNDLKQNLVGFINFVRRHKDSLNNLL